MALKLKDETVSTVQKTGSDYINSDYSRMADEILQGENELPESRYSTSNSYQTMQNDIKDLNAQYRMDELKRQNTYYSDVKSYSGRRLPKLSWFTDDNNEISIYIGIVICAIFFMMYFHKGMTSLIDINRDTVEVEATIISVEHKEEYVKNGRRHGRWEDRYKTTYEWVGENGEIQTNTRIYDERLFSKGDTATVTVLADDLNHEIDSKTTAKGKVASSFFFCIALGALIAVFVIRLKK